MSMTPKGNTLHSLKDNRRLLFEVLYDSHKDRRAIHGNNNITSKVAQDFRLEYGFIVVVDGTAR